MLLRMMLLALAIPVLLALGAAFLARGMFSADQQPTSSVTSRATSTASTGWGVPPSATEAAATETSAVPTPSTTSTYPPVRITGQECARTGTGPYAAAAAGNSRTTCTFAVAVQRAYVAAGGSGSPMAVTAYSAARGENVEMVCQGEAPVRCTGSTGALVYLYGGPARTS